MLHKEVQTLKAELHTLTSNFKSVLSVRAKIDFLQKSLKVKKKEMQQLKTKKNEIEERIIHFEEEI